jgi:hypothetical protein
MIRQIGRNKMHDRKASAPVGQNRSDCKAWEGSPEPVPDRINSLDSQRSTPSDKPNGSLRSIIQHNPGVLSLEYSIVERDSDALWRDLLAMEAVPPVSDQALRYRRALTVQALRKRGEL